MGVEQTGQPVDPFGRPSQTFLDEPQGGGDSGAQEEQPHVATTLPRRLGVKQEHDDQNLAFNLAQTVGGTVGPKGGDKFHRQINQPGNFDPRGTITPGGGIRDEQTQPTAQGETPEEVRPRQGQGDR